MTDEKNLDIRVSEDTLIELDGLLHVMEFVYDRIDKDDMKVASGFNIILGYAVNRCDALYDAAKRCSLGNCAKLKREGVDN